MAKKKAKKAAKKTAKKKAAKKSTKKTPAKKAAKKKSTKKATKPKAKAAKKSVKKKPARAAKASSSKKAPVKKSTVINPYLTFNGTCEEAFNFYKSVFGGKFTYLGRFNEMPPSEGQPPMTVEDGIKIMHVSLPISSETSLMGSDTSPAYGKVIEGDNFSISITATSKAEADRLYNGLAAGGNATMPMSKTFWGSYFGMLKDKFGIFWMVSLGNE